MEFKGPGGWRERPECQGEVVWTERIVAHGHNSRRLVDVTVDAIVKSAWLELLLCDVVDDVTLSFVVTRDVIGAVERTDDVGLKKKE